MQSVSMRPASPMGNTAVRFGNQDKAQPETLKPFVGLADGGTLVYLAADEDKKTYTFYVKPHARATKEYAAKVIADFQEMYQSVKETMPGATIQVKHFDDRPANAVVLK